MPTPTPLAAEALARVRTLYETSDLPVREIARLAGITERMVYGHARTGGWAPRSPARRPRGSGGRFVPHSTIVSEAAAAGLQAAAAAHAAAERAALKAERAAQDEEASIERLDLLCQTLVEAVKLQVDFPPEPRSLWERVTNRLGHVAMRAIETELAVRWDRAGVARSAAPVRS